MKFIKKLGAVILSVAMLAATAVIPTADVSAIENGGAIESEDYTVGVDLSIWNVGGSSVLDYDAVDFAKMKADGCDFAILRIGLEYSGSGKDDSDWAFLEYYKRARKAGMKLGAYFFSRATTYEQAKQDAEWTMEFIEDNNLYFEYPICYDVEADVHYALSARQLTNVCYGWAETLEANNYYPAIYLNRDFYTKLTDDFKAEYDIWYRYIASDDANAEQYDPAEMNISDKCSLWQYTMYQSFDGCSVEYTKNQLDGNVSYKDYASIMENYGYNNCGADPYRNLASNKSYTVDANCDPGYTANLTDGIASMISPDVDKTAWACVGQGPLEDPETCERCNGTVTVDLGAVYDITGVATHVFKDENANCINSIAVGFSVDGENFEEICGLNLDYFATSPYWAISDVADIKETMSQEGITLNTNARYVRLSFSSGESAADCISLINEIEVYGNLVGDTSNIAIGKKLECPKAIRGYTAILNDGKVASTFAPGSSDWYGLFYNSAAADQNCPTSVGTINIDLYQPCALDEIKLHYGSGSGVSPVDGATVYVSMDGENYSKIMVMDRESADAVGWFTADLSGMVARYIKVEVVVNAGGYWGMLDEIEVYGIEPEGTPLRGDIDGDGEIGKEDYVKIKRFCFETYEFDENAKRIADVNNDGEVNKEDYLMLKRFCFDTTSIDDPYVY